LSPARMATLRASLSLSRILVPFGCRAATRPPLHSGRLALHCIRLVWRYGRDIGRAGPTRNNSRSPAQSLLLRRQTLGGLLRLRDEVFPQLRNARCVEALGQADTDDHVA
jgi:hypothetical protein